MLTIVFIVVCSVLSGANPFAAIEQFGLDRRTWFARFFDLTNGLPSDDTFASVLARIDPGAFAKGLWSGSLAVPAITDHRLIALDGQTRRGAYDRSDGQAARPLVSAWASENKLSLGQVVVDEKSNAIAAIPELLRVLDVSGALVTSDAWGGPQEIAARLREAGGDSVLAVTPNQPTLSEQGDEALSAGREPDATARDEHPTVEMGHGRQETRTYALFPAPETVDPDGGQRDLSVVGRAVTERTDSPGRGRRGAGSSILSVFLSTPEFAGAVRGHGSIENHLHWPWDVSFRADECRVRTDPAPAHLSGS